jgi:hypothetical protein
MNTQLSESADILTIQTIIDEAHAMGLRVVHKPDELEEMRVMNAHTSVEG